MHAKMHAHWKQFGPPVYMSVAAYLGYGKKKTVKDTTEIRKYAGPNGIIH